MSTKLLAATVAAEDPRAVSMKRAAEMLECSVKSIQRLIKRGLLKPCRVLRHPRIPIKQIKKLLGE